MVKDNIHETLTDGELTQLLVYILKYDRTKWYGVISEDRKDVDILIDFMNGKDLKIIDYFEASEEIVTKDKLRAGFKRVLEIDRSERRPDEPNWKPIDIYSMNGETLSDIILQFAVLGGANYSTNYKKCE